MKLLPASAHVADALAAALRTCNRAANAASEVAFDRDLKRRNGLQEAVYPVRPVAWALRSAARSA
ncbi:RNA-guided endonuclease TnpB family protein, partial [Streptomyces sp. NPDC003857]